MKFDDLLLDNLALSRLEYEIIVERIQREPNYLELGLFGSLWSEHCGYQHSKLLLKRFDVNHSRLLVNAGEENSGVVDIGDDLAISFKIESHNHPSAIEPYEGAATGVGGIVRDIFAMGARPIALLNSLRFGPLTHSRNKYIFNGVVSGISNYGNCLGIPNIGGEVSFSYSYIDNPLVNAMCIGLLNKKDLMRSDSGSPGNLLLLAGSGTGKDGIHGASGLASTTFANERELRPTVQVGNPFLEKKLIEACLEIVYSGKIDGMQDLGAAGLTSAAVECAANGGNGIEIDVSLISRRDSDMEPYEVMLSETQERMLMSVKPENLKFVINIFEKWDINSEVIGTVTDTANTVITDNGKVIADLPVYILTDPPLYTLNGIESSEVGISRNFDLSKFSLSNDTPSNIFLKILASENIASRKFIFSQYDHQVQTNTVVGPGGDAALIRIKGTNKGLASATDGNSKMCYLDPYIGSQIAVAEACRNVSCTGATPIAITNCLNFGDPEKPEIYYQLDRCVSGIADAANIFDSPVISGNVSLYNGTGQSDIYPTPIIGAVGLIDNVNKYCGAGFVNENDLVAVLGVSELSLDVKYLAGSEYLDVLHGKVMGAPEIDMDFELKLQKTCVALINDQLLNSSHDCSDGGLAITIAESAILGNKGFELSSEIDGRWDSALFGEKQSRIVISFNPKYLDQIREICNINCLPYIVIGEVLFDRFRMKDFIDINLVDLSDIWHQSLELLSQ